MATHPRNSWLTDLQWDLALGDRDARDFIEYVDGIFPGLIDHLPSTITVPVLDNLYKKWTSFDGDPLNSVCRSSIRRAFDEAAVITPETVNRLTVLQFINKRAQAHRNA